MAQDTFGGKVAVVAGATRGAGRGIACMLGEAGATVYCVGRSSRKNNSSNMRPETPFYIGKAVVALATDPRIMDRSGHSLSAGYLAREYNFTDMNGSQPPGYAWGRAPIVEGAFMDGCFGPHS